MNIKSFETKQFAGLTDREISFDNSLNVILGPNESGKSTLINALYSTMFKDIKLRNNNNLDKDFRKNFMPATGGDFINGKIIINTEDGDFELYKEWGSSEDIYLKTPDNKIIKDENSINNFIKDKLNYSESTYSNIVFTKQKKLKESINNILENSDITREVSDILRKSLMELDGISIEDISNNINAELENIYKKWDLEKNAPQNNRDINNPYKNGYGELLDAYYKYRISERDTRYAYTSEKNFEEISKKINEAKNNLRDFTKEKESLDLIKEDVNKRQILDTEIKAIKKEYDSLKDINDIWPRNEEKINFLKKEEMKLLEENDQLNEEKKLSDKFKKKNSIKNKIDNIEKISNDIKNFEEELLGLSKIDNDNLRVIENLNNRLIEIEATLKAGNIIARLNKINDREVFIQIDFNEEEIMNENEEYFSQGFIKIKSDDFELEIKCGEIDYNKLENEYREIKEKLKLIFEKLKVEDFKEAKESFEKYENISKNILNLKEKVSLVLEDEKIEDLKNQYRNLEDIRNIKDEEEINLLLKINNDKQVEIKSKIRALENQIGIWVEKYGDKEILFDKIIDLKADIKFKEKNLKGLKPLPESFKSVYEFNERLKRLEYNINSINSNLDLLYNEFYNAKSELTENTFEESKRLYSLYKKDFEKKYKKGQKLLYILKVFNQTKEKFDEDPMEPLINDFQNLLNIITAGRYSASVIDENFNINLSKGNENMPVDLLSAGTYDSVALALRFSIIKYLFNDNGFVVLDDCLVDLDPQRKEEAVKLIKEFSKNYQIIFTTCDPKTAEMLGGNLIEI